jgi:Zn-dependent protease/CBS domain-containing protein
MFFGGGITLGRILGIEVRIDYTWLFIFLLITLSVSQRFAYLHPGWTGGQHWTAGVIASLLFFVSIFLHEMGHSVVAQAHGIKVSSITLFIFGGVAAIQSEPRRPGAEFWIAIAGPLVSVSLAGAFLATSALVGEATVPTSILHAVTQWLGYINIALAVFNMIPGFPLDGGRVLRSIIWKITGSLEQATRVAAMGGQIVAYFFIALGIFLVFVTGEFVGGLWMAFIGWFLLRAAQGSVTHMALRNAIEGVRAGDVADTNVPYVSPAKSVKALVDEYVLFHGLHRFLVFDGDTIRGMVTLHDIKNVPREEWPYTSVQAILVPTERLYTVRPGDSLDRVMELLDQHALNQVPVVENGVFYGLVTRETIVRLLRSRMEFGR